VRSALNILRLSPTKRNVSETFQAEPAQRPAAADASSRAGCPADPPPCCTALTVSGQMDRRWSGKKRLARIGGFA
jgi:hypothetical protein